MAGKLIIGIPSKGRLMEDTLGLFRAAGLPVEKTGDERGYRGAIAGLADASVEFLSAGEIARQLQTGRIHLGVTGEDLVREQIPDADDRIEFLLKLGFGDADVVTAIPNCWLDVETMADLEEAGDIRRPTWKAPSHRNEISHAHAPLLYVQGGCELPDRRKPRGDGRRAGCWKRRSHRRHHEYRIDAQGQWPSHPKRRGHPEIGSEPGTLEIGLPAGRGALSRRLYR